MCIILPFTDMKVNLYNYTVINKLKETRLLLRVDNRQRPIDNYKDIMKQDDL